MLRSLWCLHDNLLLDAVEEIRKEELRKEAQKELEEWYIRYREQIEKAKQANRWGLLTSPLRRCKVFSASTEKYFLPMTRLCEENARARFTK